MSKMYERIERLCKDNLMDITKMCRELDIPRSSLSELKSGRAKSISADKVSKIADYFHVCASYITNGIPEKFADHIVPYHDAENIKSFNRNIVSQYPIKPLEDCFIAQIRVFECLFTRSVYSSGYNPNHVSFEEYVAYMLGQNYIKESIPSDVYDRLVDIYGTKRGMADGTSYIDVPLKNPKIIDFPTITEDDIKFALFGGDAETISDEAFEDVKRFAQIVAEKERRKRENGNNTP